MPGMLRQESPAERRPPAPCARTGAFASPLSGSAGKEPPSPAVRSWVIFGSAGSRADASSSGSTSSRRAPSARALSKKPVADEYVEHLDGMAQRMSAKDAEFLDRMARRLQLAYRGHRMRRAMARERMHKQMFSDEAAQHFERKMQMADEKIEDLSRHFFVKSHEEYYWTHSNAFNAVVGCIIVVNSVCLGLEADLAEAHPFEFVLVEYSFCVLFSLELVLHFAVEGFRVYFGDHTNWLDFALVMCSIVDAVVQISGVELGSLRLMSCFRMLRLSRLCRLFRIFRFCKELNMIVIGFFASMKTLTWAMLFLFIVVYVSAIYTRTVIGGAHACGPLDGPECNAKAKPLFTAFNPEIGDQSTLFGAVDKTMLTLFICFTEGCGMSVIRPVCLEAPWQIIFFIGFIFFTTYGVLNLIVGQFVEKAMISAAELDKEILQCKDEHRRQLLSQMRDMFIEMDEDGSGSISKTEFYRALKENAQAREAFVELGLVEERNLWDTLDADRTGCISFPVFFEGVLLITKGQETAKAKDMVNMTLLCKSLVEFDTKKLLREQRSVGAHQRMLGREIGVAQAQCQETRQLFRGIDSRLQALNERLARVAADTARAGLAEVASDTATTGRISL